MVGLGHMRRNLLVAQALASGLPEAAILLVAEAREASALPMPPGVDCLTLPALQKHSDGSCSPRHLNLALSETVALRGAIIAAALDAFDPDLLIVDHLPLGAHRELQRALDRLRAAGRTRCVLGLRDILDSAETVRDEWQVRGYTDAIEDYFDAVWVYGDPAVFDATREYDLPPVVTGKLRFTGYFDTRARLRCAGREGDHLNALGLPDGPLALCLVGGGVDGDCVARAFVQATLPPGAHGVVVTGPFMPAEARRELYGIAAGRPNLRMVDFVSEPAFLVSRADWIVTMGGYNSVCDVLAFGKRALVVPRQWPRCEQRIRAERLAALGLVDVLAPEEATVDSLERWFVRTLDAARPKRRVDMHALDRLPRLAADVLRERALAPLVPAGHMVHARESRPHA